MLPVTKVVVFVTAQRPPPSPEYWLPIPRGKVKSVESERRKADNASVVLRRKSEGCCSGPSESFLSYIFFAVCIDLDLHRIVC